MIDEIRLKLDNLAAVLNEVEKLGARLEGQRAAIMATVQADIDKIMVSIKPELDALDYEFNKRIASETEFARSLETEIKAEVIVNGASVKATYLRAVYSKGRITWDDKKLDGMMSLIPQLVDARNVGDPSVTIRKV